MHLTATQVQGVSKYAICEEGIDSVTVSDSERPTVRHVHT